MSNQFSRDQLESQPFRKIFSTLVRVSPMNIEVTAALLFLVSIIIYPSGFFFNVIFAALAAYIVYGAVRRAEVYTLLQDAALPDEISSQVRHFFVKPQPREVVRQMFRSGINIIFLVAIIINLISILGYVEQATVPVASVVSSVVLMAVYALFTVSNGYTRAQMVATYGKAPGLFG